MSTKWFQPSDLLSSYLLGRSSFISRKNMYRGNKLVRVRKKKSKKIQLKNPIKKKKNNQKIQPKETNPKKNNQKKIQPNPKKNFIFLWWQMYSIYPVSFVKMPIFFAVLMSMMPLLFSIYGQSTSIVVSTRKDGDNIFFFFQISRFFFSFFPRYFFFFFLTLTNLLPRYIFFLFFFPDIEIFF